MFGTNRRLQVLALVAVVLFAVAVCVLSPGPEKRRWFRPPDLRPAEARLATKHSESGSSGPKQMGNLPFTMKDGQAALGKPTAKVKVVAYIPGHGGCGNETALVLNRLVKANPDRLAVRVVDFESAAGGKSQGKAGLSCAGLTINGKQQFEAKDASGKVRKLNFHSNLGDKYREDDLYLGLDQAFSEAYGAGAKCKRPAPAKPKAASPPAQAARPASPPPASGKSG